MVQHVAKYRLPLLLSAAMLMSCGGAVHDKRERLGLRTMLLAPGMKVSCVSIYPNAVIPFLDAGVHEEAVLKAFLRTVCDMHIYSLHSGEVMEDICHKAMKAGYAKSYDEDEGYRHMVLLVDVGCNKVVKSLVLLIREEDRYYYCIEASGEMQQSAVALLRKTRPDFFDSYLKRFNIKL